MPQTVNIKKDGCYYIVPLHEFIRYWVPAIPKDSMPAWFKDVPEVSKMAALKRGKGFKRTEAAYNAKGNGKHAKNPH